MRTLTRMETMMSEPSKIPEVKDWIVNDSKKLPKWKCCAARMTDGRIMFPAGCVGNEHAIMLSAAWDGEPIIVDKGHVYVSIDWLIHECPKQAENLTIIKERLLKLTSTEVK
jgi:hypothetical protein